jgi:hypothetical protein
MKFKVHKSSAPSKIIPAAKDAAAQAKAFPVVAIGASASGLEAYKDLFHALPVDTGMAFLSHSRPDSLLTQPQPWFLPCSPVVRPCWVYALMKSGRFEAQSRAVGVGLTAGFALN